MNPATLLLSIFLALFLAHYAWERWLAVLNWRHSNRDHSGLPPMLREHVTPEAHERNLDYQRQHTLFDHVENTIAAILILVYLFSPFIPWLQSAINQFFPRKIHCDVLLIASFTIITGFLQVPLELYEIFIIEARFNFNRMTVGEFWLDKIKELVVFSVLGIPFLYILFGLISSAGEWWWLWAALLTIGFECSMMILYPVVIAPLFNEFTPLPDGELKTSLDNLIRECHFPAQGIYVMDGSSRSTHSNAYFAGFGGARRIVLYDTLIEQLDTTELTAILAHEIGHWRCSHILKMLGISSLLTLAGFFLLWMTIHWPPLYQAFGYSKPDPAIGILLFGMLGGTFTFWLTPFLNRISRRNEYEADAFAVKMTHNPSAMESALFKLYQNNLSNLTPHPWYSSYHYSHPTPLERMQSVRAASSLVVSRNEMR
ncbi:MAG: M48 family metallopeptidase [Verrucomicrobiae bacterium]|nr:M48 family metallopeptidase [Verrucomicrobiae bacterium]